MPETTEESGKIGVGTGGFVIDGVEAAETEDIRVTGVENEECL